MHLFVYLLYQTTHWTSVPTTHRDHISPVPNIFVQGMKKLLVDLAVRGAIPFSLCLSICGNLPNVVPKFQYVFYASAHTSVRMSRRCLSISTGIIMAGR